jgi:predicted DNA repair protein MutK|tara:strand:+ start:13650 stop:14591 length:942 start_codon:yes stop_codon:yes gene_type:complete
VAGGSLLLLLDDIAAVLDDVALMTKIAAKKTAGVLGDDLAVNAEKVSGVSADRELPVVWAVAKGSLRNKCILVPAAMVVSLVAPWLITPVLILGGLFLCYEGFEKVAHRFFHSKAEDIAQRNDRIKQLSESPTDLASFEQQKIKGAIRTDLILSAEIIVLTLGIVAEKEFITQFLVLSGIAFFMTVGVYGVVAGIVKLDDAGLYLIEKSGSGIWPRFQRWWGARLLVFAPWLMKALAVVGTVAMFMVGGGILVHGLHVLDEGIKFLTEQLGEIATVGPVLAALTPTLAGIVIGMAAGAAVLALVMLLQRLRGN